MYGHKKDKIKKSCDTKLKRLKTKQKEILKKKS